MSELGLRRRSAARLALAMTVILACVRLVWAAEGTRPAPGQSGRQAEKQGSKTASQRTQPAFRWTQADQEAAWTRMKEQKLDGWVPTKENAQAPATALRSAPTDISGKWEVRRGYDSSSLTFTRSGPNKYDVAFSTGGCLGSWNLQRTGHYSEGELVLNRPVEEYCPFTYRKLYVLRVAGREYLVADAAVREFQKGVAQNGTSIIDSSPVRFYAFTRSAPLVQSAPKPDKLSPTRPPVHLQPTLAPAQKSP